MRSPAQPETRRVCVNTAHQFGLDSIRVRTCDPGADAHLTNSPVSRRWSEDLADNCDWRLPGLAASVRRSAGSFDDVSNSPWIDDVETLNEIVLRDDCGSTSDQPAVRTSSHALSGLRTDDRQHLVSSPARGLSPGRKAPSFELIPSFLSDKRRGKHTAPAPGGRCGRQLLASQCFSARDRQTTQRTHSLTRVSDEKRNADECPATGGKPHRHR